MWVCYGADGPCITRGWYCAARVPKKVLRFAGIEDVFTSSRGSMKTLGNFVKTYGFLTPDFWRKPASRSRPSKSNTDLLAKPTSKIIHVTEDNEARAVL